MKNNKVLLIISEVIFSISISISISLLQPNIFRLILWIIQIIHLQQILCYLLKLLKFDCLISNMLSIVLIAVIIILAETIWYYIANYFSEIPVIIINSLIIIIALFSNKILKSKNISLFIRLKNIIRSV